MGAAAAHGAPDPGPAVNLYLVDPGASAWQWEPLTAKVAQLYRRGRLPLWNASQGFGAPLAANMQSAAYFVPALPLLLRPSPKVWDAYLLARLLAAGVATFAVMRLFDAGRLGATGAAAAFMLSGYFLFWLNNSWLSIDVLVPALVYGVERVVRRPAGPWVLLVGFLCSLTVLGGMPEATFVVLLFTGAVALVRLAALRAGGAPWPSVARPALTLLAAAVLGVGASAVLLVPFAEYLGQSWHQHTTGATQGLSYFPLRTLVTLVAPYVDGPPLSSSPVPLYYTGMVALTLAAVGALTRRQTANWLRWASVAAAGLAVAKAFSPGLNWIGIVPVFALVDLPKHLGVVICFAVAVLAGLGLDAVARGRVARLVAIVGPLAVQAGALGLLAIHGWALGARLDWGYFVRGLGLGAALAAATQLALLLSGAGRRSPRLAALACVGLLVGELVALAPRVDRPHRYPPDATPPAVRFVREDRSAYRVFGLDGVLYPNTATFFDLRDIRGLDALYPERYLLYVRELVNPSVFDRFTGGRGSSRTAEGASRCGGNPWFDLLGVKYVFAPAGWSLTECSAGWADLRVEGEADRAARYRGQYTLVYDGELRVFRNATAMPRAFVVHRAEAVPDPATALRQLKRPGFDPATTVVLEAPPAIAAPLAAAAAGSSTPAVVLADEDDRVTVATTATSPGILVLTDIFYPGWVATVDGAPVPIYPADYAFRGVVVPAGSHLVTFAYRPTSFAAGAAISGVSLLLLAGLAVVTRRRERWPAERG